MLSSTSIDELGYLPFARSGGQLLFHLVSRLYERTSLIVTTSASANGRVSLVMPK
jgi:DNA replication protein DnaC